ncbi:MAG: hypothetical protein ACRC1G_12575 [Bradyrhizobium sp.]|nr:hypothetical protein [Bradyrhizobium sp.]
MLALGFPIALVALWAGPFDLTFIGVPILLVAWICAALVALGMSVQSALIRSSWRAFSWLVLPLVTIAAAADPQRVWGLAIEAGQRIHFQAVRASYLNDVSQLPSNEPRFLVWRWGGFGVGHGVAYDESDEIALPERSVAWNKRVAGTEVGMCGAWGIPLGDHFYLVRMGC